MAEAAISRYDHFRWQTALPQRLVEYEIIVTAREWSVLFGWFFRSCIRSA